MWHPAHCWQTAVQTVQTVVYTGARTVVQTAVQTACASPGDRRSHLTYQALPHIEAVQFLFLSRLDRHLVHESIPRPVVGPVDQFPHCLGRSLDVDLDHAVGQVAYPSLQPQLPGLPAAGVAEVHSLHAAMDEQVAGDVAHAPILTHHDSRGSCTPVDVALG